MRQIFTLLILHLLTFSAISQVNGTVKGKLLDTLAKQSLADATVSVLQSKDSTPVTFAISDKGGSFEIKNLDTGLYRLLVTFQGYRPFSKNFMISKDFPVS